MRGIRWEGLDGMNHGKIYIRARSVVLVRWHGSFDISEILKSTHGGGSPKIIGSSWGLTTARHIEHRQKSAKRIKILILIKTLGWFEFGIRYQVLPSLLIKRTFSCKFAIRIVGEYYATAVVKLLPSFIAGIPSKVLCSSCQEAPTRILSLDSPTCAQKYLHLCTMIEYKLTWRIEFYNDIHSFSHTWIYKNL